MTPTRHNNPFKLLWLAGAILVLIAVVFDPMLRGLLISDRVAAVGGYDAVDLLGQLDGGGNPDYFTGEINNDGTGTPNAQGFRRPLDSVLDTTNHRLFVSDKANHRILIFDLDANDELVNRTADYVIGQTDFVTGTGGTTKRKLNSQAGLAYDAAGSRLFVADAVNDRIMVFDVSLANLASDGNGTDAINVLGQTDFITGTNGTTQSTLWAPNGLTYEVSGNRLFVAEEGNSRVTVFNVAAITDGENAINVLGQPNFTTSTPGTTQSKLTNPLRTAYDAAGNRLFVSDTENHRVMIWDVATIGDGEPAANVLGQTLFTTATPGTTQSTLRNPEGVAYDASGNRLFVADRANNRVMIFSVAAITDGENATDVYGQTDFTTATPGTTQSTFSAPRGVQWVGTRLYVADDSNNRLMIFEETPLVLHEASDDIGQLTGADAPDFDHSGVNNSPNSRGFDGPTHVAIDGVNHRLFVADFSNNRILQFDLDTNNLLIDRIADHVIGQPDFRSFDASAGTDSFTEQTDVLYDGANDLLYVADSGNHRVMVFDVATITDGEDAVNVLGQTDFSGVASATSQSGLWTPDSLALDSTGNRLFVGDFGNRRVTVFNVATITNGEPAINVLGKEDFVTRTEDLDQDGLAQIDGLAYDSVNQRLFVVDGNHRVMVFDVATITDGEDAVNVLGQAGFGTETPAAGAAGMNNPAGLSLDEAGQRLFVDDYNNHRITVFSVAAITNGEDAVNVLGQSDFTGTSAGLSASAMDGPYGIEYDPLSSLLYAAEDVNARVTIFDVSTIVNGEDAVNLLGQLDENDEPVYTTNGWNNFPNAQGLASAYGAVALDTANHRLFVTDRENHRILVFNLDASNVLVNHTADFVLGQPDFKSNAASTSATTLFTPVGISYDGPDDLLFVADADNHRVIVYDTASIVNGEPAIHQLGQANFTSGSANRGGGSNAAINSFLAPESVSIEPVNGLLAVSDGNNRVLIYDFGGAGLPLLANGMDASRVYGHPDFITETSGTTATTMADPRGVLAETITSSLWVADTSNNRVLRFDLFDPNSVDGAPSAAALNVLGQSNFTSSTAAVTQNGMSGPVHLALVESIGSDQRLFVTDGVSSNRVLVFNTFDGIVNGEDAVDVYGQVSFTASVCATSQGNLCVPRGLEYDEVNTTLYVADGDNNRIMIFGPVGAPTPTPTPPPGGGGSPQGIGFFPDRIVINDEDANTDSRNVLVDIYAHHSDTFSGTVDVLLSNTSDFSTTIPFRYVVSPQSGTTSWLKTVAWDLCFGLQKSICDLGRKVVYARFYVNLPSVWPALTPLGQPTPAP